MTDIIVLCMRVSKKEENNYSDKDIPLYPRLQYLHDLASSLRFATFES